jgi:hypothetical protein
MYPYIIGIDVAPGQMLNAYVTDILYDNFLDGAIEI